MEIHNISIIIPTKERDVVLASGLQHLLRAISGTGIEVIVVNDSKKTVPVIPDASQVKLLNNPGSGVASARNLGVQHATRQWILFLDDDMLISRENLLAYKNYLENTDKICVNLNWTYPPELVAQIKNYAFGRYLIAKKFTSLKGWNKEPGWIDGGSFKTYGMTSQNLMIRKSHFLSSGGYEASMPHAGSEDHIFSLKLQKLGFSFIVDTTTVMFHNEEDRVIEKEWFRRKERGGETRKAAVLLGYNELTLHYSPMKKLFYAAHPIIAPLVRSGLFISTRSPKLDRISFLFYNILLGISIYKGYSKLKTGSPK